MDPRIHRKGRIFRPGSQSEMEDLWAFAAQRVFHEFREKQVDHLETFRPRRLWLSHQRTGSFCGRFCQKRRWQYCHRDATQRTLECLDVNVLETFRKNILRIHGCWHSGWSRIASAPFPRWCEISLRHFTWQILPGLGPSYSIDYSTESLAFRNCESCSLWHDPFYLRT